MGRQHEAHIQNKSIHQPHAKQHIQTHSATQRSSVAPHVGRARAAHRCFLRGGVLRPLLEGLSESDGVSWRRSPPFAAGRLSGEPDRRRPRGDPLSLSLSLSLSLLLLESESESELSELELSDELLLLELLLLLLLELLELELDLSRRFFFVFGPPSPAVAGCSAAFTRAFHSSSGAGGGWSAADSSGWRRRGFASCCVRDGRDTYVRLPGSGQHSNVHLPGFRHRWHSGFPPPRPWSRDGRRAPSWTRSVDWAYKAALPAARCCQRDGPRSSPGCWRLIPASWCVWRQVSRRDEQCERQRGGRLH